ncbi:signal recognition particle-docking protein FtsY [Bartonella sp. AR 15-3]|uniref:signal recognition particle-docking protein FtsY n=1 Tax=Bartonella sp. AR 15-3 TaxID=545617 RepID=UPI0001F4BFC7|nr:signal recognition particle-docking protein FtsY [Bartonella sp. AR 15-3]OPB32371.1 signal recognition particle-docking protein FtsY [Bartonella sp. AR 15-3]CBI80031.1 cell division protein [Bartonella sp. AR 15-3]
MTKSFIKKIFSFNTSKEKEIKKRQILTPHEIDEEKQNEYKNENTKSKVSSIDVKKEKQEQKKIEEITLTKNFPSEESSRKVIVSDTIIEKKIETSLSIPTVEQKKAVWFERLKKGLSLSSQQLSDSIGTLFVKKKLDENTLQELEDILIQADLGIETTTRIIDILATSRYEKNFSSKDIYTIVTDEIKKVLEPVAFPLEIDLNHKPHVILLVGVNGTGKTTTIGKLAAKLTAGGLKVMLVAGDTFRAAAIEQLHIWGERTKAPVISGKLGADAASLAFDAYGKAKKENSDVLIIDTAGRLQNKIELMDELAKIIRVLGKHNPQAPHTVLQTLDATTGQNALNQVNVFRDIAGVNGLVMTKLDGSARGGILVAIASKHKLPVHFIGIGENVEDLEPFSASDFAEAIIGKYA